MTKNKKPIVRIYTGNNEFIDREMNDDEFAQYEIDQAAHIARKAEAEAKETAKAAILDRIGLTADELKTILG
jgi:hypothetical protein